MNPYLPLSILLLTLSLTVNVISAEPGQQTHRNSNRIRSNHHQRKSNLHHQQPQQQQQHQDRSDREQDQMEQLTKQLLRDIGSVDAPSISKANISESEYTKMLHIYQKSLRHTEILEELQEELAELEEEEEDRSAADAASPSTTSSTHHFFTAQNSGTRRYKRFSGASSTLPQPSSSSSSSSYAITSEGEIQSLALKFALDLPEDFDETRDLTLVQTAKLYLSLSSSLPNGKGGRGEEEGEKDIKITIRQLIEGEEYKDEDGFSRSNQDRASSDLNSKTIIIESATFKVSEILGEERKEGASRSGPRGTIQSEEEEEEEEEEEKGEASELEFDISHTVQVWLREPEENLGLVIECEGCYEAQLELKQNPTLRVDLERRRRSKNSFLHPLSLAGRQKRSYFRSSIKAKRRNRVDCKPDAVFHKKGRKNKKQRCCREKMTINFAELPGFENILQPTTFDAYFCQGRCPSRFNPANGHALLQSLMHVASKHLPKEERVPQPCCAPSKMLPLPILHYTGKLEVSHWKNVIVGECKCT